MRERVDKLQDTASDNRRELSRMLIAQVTCRRYSRELPMTSVLKTPTATLSPTSPNAAVSRRTRADSDRPG
ncbi:hypothetical protein C8039_19180 [Halogeometricum sp. wsp3]|nr:hypothetical protein C8039_19180 [Halogeometricum sp. wsp3]